MAAEFEGDLREATFWGADLAGATFWGADMHGTTMRDVDLTGSSVSHALIVDVDIDAVVERLVVNGVDVTDYVNAHDPWAALRGTGRTTTAAGMRTGWGALRQAWDDLLDVVESEDDGVATTRVDDEWSSAETVRHLVFVVDKWCLAPVLGRRYASIGMSNSGSVDVPWPGVDRTAAPDVGEVLTVWRARADDVDDVMASLADEDLTRVVDVVENGPHPVGDCLRAVLEELFWHLRYAHRDLGRLGVGVPAPPTSV